jgi:phage-related protein
MSIGGSGEVVGRAVYNLTMDDSEYQRAMNRVEDSADNLEGTFNRVGGAAHGMISGITNALTNFGLNAITRTVGGFTDAVFGMNASLETSTLQFATLFQNAERAEQHVADLFEFAKVTPFETDPILQASRLLQSYGGDALNTTEYLYLLGDAAAGMSAPFEDVAMHVGRVYAAIQGGQPFGESAARLQELAILTAPARIEMERLQKAGAGADEVFAVLERDMARFGGAMTNMAGTWDGAVGTFTDSVQILLATAFRPLFDAAARGLNAINAILESGFVDRLTNALAGGLSAAISGTITAIMWLVDVLRGPLSRGIGAAVSVVMWIVRAVQGPLRDAWVAARDGVLTFLQAIRGEWVPDDRVTTLHLVIGRIGTAAGEVIRPLRRLFDIIAGAVGRVRQITSSGGSFTQWMDGLPPVIRPVVRFVTEMVRNFRDVLTVINPVSAVIWRLVAAFGRGGLRGALEAFPDILRDVGGSFRRVGGLIMDLFRELVPDIIAALMETDWGGIADDLLTLAGDAIGAVDWAGVAGQIWEAFRVGAGVAGDLGADLYAVLSEEIGGVDWAEVGRTILGLITGALSGAGAAVSEAGPAVLDAIRTGIRTVTDFGSDVGGWIIDQLSAVDYAGIGGTILGALGTGITTGAGLVAQLTGWAWEQFTGIDWAGIGGDIVALLFDAITTVADVATRIAGWVGGWFADLDWQAIAGTVATALFDAITAVADVATRIAGWVGGWFADLDWASIAGTLVDGLMGAIEGIESAAGTFAAWIGGLLDMVDWSGIAGDMVTDLTDALGAVADAGARVGGWLAGVFGAVEWSGIAGAVAGGLADALETVAGFALRFGTWFHGQIQQVDWSGIGTTIMDGMGGALETSQGWGQRMIDWMTGTITVANFEALGGAIGSGLSGAIEWTGDLGIVESLTSTIGERLNPVLDVLAEVSGRLTVWDNIRSMLSDTWAVISEDLNPILTELSGLWSDITDLVGPLAELFGILWGRFTENQKPIADIVQTLSTGLMPILRTIGIIVGGIVIVALNVLSGILSNVLPRAISIALTIIRVLITNIRGIVQVITGIVEVIIGIFTGDWQRAWDGMRDVVDGIIDTVRSNIEGFISIIGDIIGGVYDVIVGVFQDIYNALVGNSIVPDTINEIIAFFSGLPGKLVDIMVDVVSAVMGAFIDLLVDAPFKVWEMVQAAADELGKLIELGREKAGEVLTAVLGKLGELAAGIPGALLEVPGAIREALGGMATEAFSLAGDIMQGFIDGLADKVPDVGGAIKKGTEWVQDGWDNLWGRKSPAKWTIDLAHDILSGFLSGFDDMAPEALARVRDLTGALQSAFAALSAGIDLSDKMQGFSAPDSGLIGQLKTFVETVTREISWAAGMFETETLEHTEAFGRTAGTVVGVMSAAVDAINAMSDLDFDLEDIRRRASDMKFAVEHMVRSLADSAAMFDDAAMPRMESFSRAALAGVELMAAVPDALRQILTFEGAGDADTATLAANMTAIIGDIVAALQDTAGLFEQQGLDAVSRFSTAAGAAMGLVGGIQTALDTIMLFGGDRDWTATVSDRMADVAWVIGHIVEQLQSVADRFSTEGLDAVSLFSASANAALGTVSSVPAALEAILGFGIGERAAERLPAAIAGMVDLARDIVAALGDVADEFTAEGLDAVNRFAGAAGTALGVMGSAGDAVRTMIDFGGLSGRVDISRLAVSLTNIVSSITLAFRAASDMWTTDASEALAAFATGAGATLDVMANAADLVQKLIEWNPTGYGFSIATRATSGLSGLVVVVIRALQSAADMFEDEGMTALDRFNATAGGALSVMMDAVSLMQELMTIQPINQWYTRTFVGNWITIVKAIEEIEKLVAERGVGAANGVMADMLAIVGILAKAGDIATSLGAIGANAGNGPTINTGSAVTVASTANVTKAAAAGPAQPTIELTIPVQIGDRPLETLVVDVLRQQIRVIRG